MVWFSMSVVVLVSVGIIAIGLMYLVNPRAAANGFGLPLPEAGANTDWWLRLKGVRDVVSGLVVLTIFTWGSPHLLGIVLLVQSLTPLGDMSTVLASKGSSKHAFGIHGLTAVLMIIAAVPLIMGAV
jgi:hypothetical protein